MFHVLSSLSGLNTLAQQAAPVRTERASADPVDRFTAQEPGAQDMLFYKPVPRLLAKPATAAANQDADGAELQRFAGKLSTAIADIIGKLRTIPALSGLAAAILAAGNSIPNLLAAVSSGESEKVTRQAADIAQNICAAVKDLGRAKLINISSESLKALGKATPALGTIVSGIDVGIDIYRGYQAPSGSQEESDYHAKRTLDEVIGTIGAIELLAGPVAPAIVAVGVGLSVASMLLGGRADKARDQRRHSK